jgi:hypothetical protein
LGKAELKAVSAGSVLFSDGSEKISGISFENNLLVCKKNAPFPVHVPLCEDTEGFFGDIEPLIWMSYHKERGAGQCLEFAGSNGDSPLCWMPGSYCSQEIIGLIPKQFGIFKADL